MSKNKHKGVKRLWKFILILVMLILIGSSLAPYFGR
jgi:hypothetical protein